MDNKNVEMIGGGIICDNPNCDWQDLSIPSEEFYKWVDNPCPLCAENLLTKQDFENSEMLRFVVEFTNGLSGEDLNELTEIIDKEELKKSDFLKDAVGLDLLKEDGLFSVSIETHKKLKVTEIKKEVG